MREIKIRDLKEPHYLLYNPKGELIGEVTSELQYNDVRLQIAERGISGYYFRSKDEIIPITNDGVTDRPLYNGNLDIIKRLLKTQCKRRIDETTANKNRFLQG
jgi:hypothetical protein